MSAYTGRRNDDKSVSEQTKSGIGIASVWLICILTPRWDDLNLYMVMLISTKRSQREWLKIPLPHTNLLRAS